MEEQFVPSTVKGFKILNSYEDMVTSPVKNFTWREGWNRSTLPVGSGQAGLYASPHLRYVTRYAHIPSVLCLVEGKGHTIMGDKAFRSDEMRVIAYWQPQVSFFQLRAIALSLLLALFTFANSLITYHMSLDLALFTACEVIVGSFLIVSLWVHIQRRDGISIEGMKNTFPQAQQCGSFIGFYRLSKQLMD